MLKNARLIVPRYPARPSKSTLRGELFGDVIYGVAPVLAALRAKRRSPHALYLQEGVTALRKKKDARAFQVRLLGRFYSDITWGKHDMIMLFDRARSYTHTTLFTGVPGPGQSCGCYNAHLVQARHEHAVRQPPPPGAAAGLQPPGVGVTRVPAKCGGRLRRCVQCYCYPISYMLALHDLV